MSAPRAGGDRDGRTVNSAIADDDSARFGAVLATDAEPIVSDIEFMLRAPGRSGPARTGAVAGGVPILDRGEVVIIPLAWAPDLAAGAAGMAGPTERQAQLQRSINALASSVDSSFGHRNPFSRGIALPPRDDEPNRYADALVAAGARRADWWWFGDHAVVLVVQGRPIPAPISHLSLHIVRASTETPLDVAPVIDGDVDLSWSWSDVVAAATSSRAAGGD